MKVAILGLGLSGRAAAHFLLKQGHEVWGVDRTLCAIEGMAFVFENQEPTLEGFDLVVKSPGIPQGHSWIERAKKLKIPVIGEVDLAFSELMHLNKKVVAITGSNGKTTTTLMTEHLLKASGCKALAVGNVGLPLLSALEAEADVLVVELSSFQLESICPIPILDGAVILNITPNHLDRHPSFEEYVQAKVQIKNCLKPNAPLYLGGDVKNIIGDCGKSLKEIQEKIETILPLSYRDSLYPHDVENLAAAFALANVTDHVVKESMPHFKRPAHRLEFVRKLNAVSYINDSKATSVDAVKQALAAFKEKLVLIAGGVDKGGSFRCWLPFLKGKALVVLALGQAAERIERELEPEINVEKIASLQEGVQRAFELAEPGTTVLLSPGCSSYDQFLNYEQRGDIFKELVGAL